MDISSPLAVELRRERARCERHQQPRLGRQVPPGPDVGLQEPLVRGEHVPAQSCLKAEDRVFEVQRRDDRGVGVLLLLGVVADRPERVGGQRELNQEDDGDEYAADQDLGCQAEAHV